MKAVCNRPTCSASVSENSKSYQEDQPKLSNCIFNRNSSFSLILCVYFNCGFLFLYRNTSKSSKTKASIAFSSRKKYSKKVSFYTLLHRRSKGIVCMSLITIIHWTMTKYDKYDCHGTSHRGYHDWQWSKTRFFETYLLE